MTDAGHCPTCAGPLIRKNPVWLNAHSEFQDETWAHDTARKHLDDLKDK